ncbi:putative Regulatory protein TetR [Frankia canadensis]|uniref:Putative Regulatory protein TetR n=1 Tax=Frankia canadensis TaxID=1836972 RepID=A0A2I2KUI6_9ACTN|nr:putative Regulatory protein TetR [Frankia canadensis]SOU56615.1 putative Regulatory protein TetR [Frankia canadensis]
MTSSTRRPRRTQAQRRDAARAAILETAVRLLAGGGYSNMTLADLGERAGYSRSLAAHYFGSKPKLLAAIIDHVRESSPPSMPDTLRGVGRIETEIIKFFDGLVTDAENIRAYIVIAHEAATSLPELLPMIHEQNVALRTRIEADLREGIRDGTVRPDLEPVSLSIAITTMIRGVAWEWFTDPNLDVMACRQAVLDQVRVLTATTT